MNMPSTKNDHHPLKMLTTDEIEAAATLLKAQLSERATFSNVGLVEPNKHDVLDTTRHVQLSRKLRFMGYDYPESKDGGFDAIVDLTSKEVSVTRIAAGQAPIGFADAVEAIKITKADPDWQAAMKARGFTNFDLVQIDPWPTGGFVHDSIPAGHRAHRSIAFIREDETDNGYARPIQGLIAHVDLTAGKVAYLEDHGEVPVPPESGRYDAANQANFRNTIKPIEITQPEGTSFQVSDNAVSWEGFNFRVSMHPINGLVLHQVCYDDAGENRPIIYRAALSDMVVPYGDPDPMHNWKHVFDAGETSIGTLANSLTLGCDCLGEIYYFDCPVVNWKGEARTIENAICMHEEDYGILWKHHDAQSQTTEVRRSRRLVVSAIHTVGNYEYGFFWYFYLDGTIQMEVKLTGIVGVSAVNDGEERPEFAPLIAPNLTSPIHQHLFCFRLDFNLDGQENNLYEVETQALPMGPDNPQGTHFHAISTQLESEKQARRHTNAASSRYWKVTNPNRTNRLGAPVAWRLLPSGTPALFAHEDSPVAKRAGFAKYNIWATRYAEDQLNAAGDTPNMHEGDAGLPAWSAEDKSLDAEDLVLWHTVGVTHVPRPEDWPVMPVEYCGFMLQPVGFFERNPTLDVPPAKHCD
ncbi:MAG: primary-amine oxidase [Pseudomonadales bacterium]|nr:primary-amine oxidase [Pseudomonadales bacterium]